MYELESPEYWRAVERHNYADVMMIRPMIEIIDDNSKLPGWAQRIFGAGQS
jgi:hypothetical protein